MYHKVYKAKIISRYMIRKKMSSKTDILFESIERRGFGHFFTHIGICLFTNWCSMQFLPYNVKGGGLMGCTSRFTS